MYRDREPLEFHHLLLLGAIGAALLVALITLIWERAHTPIATFLLALRRIELSAISLFNARADGLIAWIDAAAPATVEVHHLFWLSHLTGQFLTIPAMILLGLMAGHMFLRGRKHSFRRRLNLDSLIRDQRITWPVISHVRAKANGVKATTGAAAALQPAQWLERFRCVDEAGQVDRTAILHALERQLIGPWRGLRRLPAPARVLAAAFVLHGAKRREDAYELLGHAARVAGADPKMMGRRISRDRALMQKANRVIRDPSLVAEAEAVCAQHAYMATALLELLSWARLRGGVLAPAQFVWLKNVVRPLWFALSSLGRRTAYAEAAGAFAHWQSEKAVGQALSEPHLDRAIDALEIHHSTLKRQGEADV